MRVGGGGKEGDLVFDYVWSFSHSGFFLWFFKCLWILGLDVRSIMSVSRLWSWMAVRYCLNMGMAGIGILVIGCCLRFSMCILLQQFWCLLVPLSSWLVFWLMKRLLELMLAMLFQEYHGLILNLFKLNCKVVWLAFLWHRYFPSLLKSNFHLVFSFSIFLLGDNICMLDFQAPSS